MEDTPKFVDDDGPVTVTVKMPEDDVRTFRSASNNVRSIMVVPDQGVWISGQGNDVEFYPMSRVLKVKMQARPGSSANIEDQQLD